MEQGKRVTHDTDIVAADYFTDPTAWPYMPRVSHLMALAIRFDHLDP
jgi:hypothetical protein